MRRLCAGSLLLLSSMLAGAQCPTAAQLADLRSGTEQAPPTAADQTHLRWTTLIDALRACGDSAQVLIAMGHRSEALYQQGAVREALISTREWLRAARGANNDDSLVARIQLRLARLQTVTGDIDAADASLQSALALLGTGSSAAILERAQAWSDLSRLDRRRGNYLDALRHEQMALALRQRSPARTDVWRSTLNIAVLYEQVELFDEARTHYQDALADIEQHGTARDITDAVNGYAGFLNDFGPADAPLALSLAQRAIALSQQFSDPVRQGSSALQVGRAQFNLGHYDLAEASYQQAMALATASTASALIAHVQFRWGELDLARNRLDASLRRVESARRDYEEQGNRHRLIKTHALLERIHQARGDALAAALAGREHFRLRNELLGAGASGKFGEMLAQFALADVRQRNEALQQENNDAELRLHAEQRAQGYLYALVIGLLIALGAVTWRNAQARRLNDLLRQKSAEIEARRTEIAAAHERLKAQSAQLYQSSITDPLTGLRNRAYGLNALRELLGNARALGLQPVVMMLDIDHFKQINDLHGHAVGDRALERVAENLLMHAPSDAIVARLGGEEFLFVLRDADASSGVFQAELIRRRLLDLRIDHDAGQLSLSVSIGVCHCVQLPQITVQAALRTADRALYQAKGAGRNCVRVG